MEKLLKDMIHESNRTERGPERRADRLTLPVHKLKLVRDGSIKYDVPRVPLSSPEHCLGILRTHFRGAPGEMVSVIALNTQNQYIDVVPVAYGTLRYVHVTNRMIFAPLIGELNAAAFILAHNHPSGNATPSPEDLALIEYVRKGGVEMDCPMSDFVIIGADGNDYYSWREDTAEKAADAAEKAAGGADGNAPARVRKSDDWTSGGQ